MYKMFRCSKCGLISEVVEYISYGSFERYLSFDENNKKIYDYANHDYEDADGWYCPDCGSDVDINVIEEVEND